MKSIDKEKPLTLLHVGGMKKPKWDPRHFSWKKKFGSVATLPTEDFDVWIPLETKDQAWTNICTACGVTGAAEAQFNMPLDECFQFAATKRYVGKIDDQGCDPIDAIKAAIKFGLLPKAKAPFNVLSDPILKIADLNNYSPELIALAAQRKEISFYKVDGQQDRFDSIRDAMWTSKQNKWPTPIMVGCLWKSSWLAAPNGEIVNDNPNEPGTYHEFEIVGQRMNGTRLRAHLSSGGEAGDHGYFYFTREFVNKFIFQLAFAPGDVEANKKELWNLLQKLYDALSNLLKLIK